MAKAKTQQANTPSLFDVFDYYNEQGELQNEPRYSEQNRDRGILRNQKQTNGITETRPLSDRSGSANLQSTAKQGGGGQTKQGMGENLQLGEIRLNGSNQRGESALHSDTRQSADGLQLGDQNVGYNNSHTNTRDTKDSELYGSYRSGSEVQQRGAAFLESSSDSKMGETRARENSHNERGESAMDNAAAGDNRARSNDESLSQTQLRESHALSSTSRYGSGFKSLPTQSTYSILVEELNHTGLNSKEAFKFLDYLEQSGYARFNESSDSYEITHILSFDLQNDTHLQNTLNAKFKPLMDFIQQKEKEPIRQIAIHNANNLSIDDLKPFVLEKMDNAWDTIVCEKMFREMNRYFDDTKHFETLRDEFYEKNPQANAFFIGDRLFTFGNSTLFELSQESMKKYFDVDLNVQSKTAYEMFALGIENFAPNIQMSVEQEADIVSAKTQTQDVKDTQEKTTEVEMIKIETNQDIKEPTQAEFKLKDTMPNKNIVSQTSLEDIDSALENNAKELDLRVVERSQDTQEVAQTESKPKNATPKTQQNKEAKGVAIPKVVATQSGINIHKARKSSETPSLTPERDLVYQGSDTNHKLYSCNELPMSKKERIEANLAAIKVAKHIEAERKEKGDSLGINVVPNEAQKEALSKYSGWGGLKEMFFPKEKDDFFYNKNIEFQKLLTASSFNEKGEYEPSLAYLQYEKARKSADDAFYTPAFIIDSLYQGLEHFGLNKDQEANDGVRDIFEPSLGVGKFIGFSPNEKYKFHGSEIDLLSSSIAQMLYPESRIENKGYELVNPNRQYDAFIGNPPYDNFKLYHKKIGSKVVCDFFIEKTMLNLKDDGIAAFVVSHNFLDKEDSRNRAAIAKSATFLGAIRLPSSAFKDSHTEVVSDIVFFKKGADTNLDWVKSSPLVLENGKETRGEYIDKDGKLKINQVYINEYFVKHKENVLGLLDVGGSEFGLELKCHEMKGLDLSAAISQAIEAMPKDVYKYHETIYSYKSHMLNSAAPQFNEVKAYLDDKKLGNLVEIDGEVLLLKESIDRGSNYKLASIDDELAVRGKPKERLKDFIKLRDSFNNLIKLEQSDIGDNDSSLQSARLQLNQTYDSFIENWGFLNSRDNRSLFRKFDCEANKILGLEKAYDKGLSKKMAEKENPPVEPRKASAKKADIFERRVIRPRAIQKIETPKDAYLMSLAIYGKVNTTFIDGALPNMDFKDIMEDLKNQKLVFENHRFGDDSKIRSVSEIEQDLAEARSKLESLLEKENSANSEQALCGKMSQILLARDSIEYEKERIYRWVITDDSFELFCKGISGYKQYHIIGKDFAELKESATMELAGQKPSEEEIMSAKKEVAALEDDLNQSQSKPQIKQEDEAYLSANVYLSGNVKEKLKELDILLIPRNIIGRW